jgi:predicted NBD/HSP70 family sugar kinase
MMIPFEVVNDGEVTALAGSMSLGREPHFGHLTRHKHRGRLRQCGWEYHQLDQRTGVCAGGLQSTRAVDEWSGDYGCCVQYFSQQCVGRLLAPAGIEVDSKLPLPEKLKHVQKLMEQGDERAGKIYQTIGTYLGYAVAHFSDFYDLENVLILGRVTSGKGGDIIIEGAKEVLQAEFPELSRLRFHIPNEKDKRHGQAMAAASLPELSRK